MNYQETTEYLFSQIPMFERQGASGYKEGLSNTLALDEHFGHPHRRFKTIHVAGTNGKGSCSHTLASILQGYGMKVGLYTSPHLLDFRERIRINGECISEDYVVDFVERERSFFEPLHPSFFEVTTAMAFKYFAEQGVDIAIIEVGLGGRLDCTNIITPILSIITNISLDHTQFLGNTIAEIAREKGGIINPRVHTIIGEYTDETRPVFEEIAASLDAPITFAEDEKEVLSVSEEEHHRNKYLTRNYGLIEGELLGSFQTKNANTILTAYSKLVEMRVIECDRKLLADGFLNVCERTGLMGRWQKIGDRPLTICDTGHNVGGWEHLGKEIENAGGKEKHIIFGMVADKDVETVMSLLPKSATYYFTQPTTTRALPSDKLAEMGRHHGLKGEEYKDVATAYAAAKTNTTEEDFIFIGGSNYLVSDFFQSALSND